MNVPWWRKLARSVKRTVRPMMPGHQDFTTFFAGKKGLEIGGPTELFRKSLPIYELAHSLDGVNFGAVTMWEGELVEGQTYSYLRGRKGLQYICEATDLSRILSESYDFVLSSNNLEHIANPLKAVAEWVRVLRPGGVLLLVLPRKESNFDHRRDITPFEHLRADFDCGMSEHDLTHVEKILELHDYAMDPPAGGPEKMRQRSLANFENRCLHHHVFDHQIIEAVFRHAGLRPLLNATTRTDYVSLARK